MKLLEGKTALITGASKGIGRSIALKYAEEGANVAFTYLSSVEKGEALVAELEASGIKAKGYRSDASDYAAAEQLINDVVADFGSLDILVNNAGIGFVGNIENTSEADFDRLYSVNVKGVFHCAKAVIPHFKAKNKGVIVNMASIAATVGLVDRFAYSMTKGAVLTMTYTIAKDYLAHNIRCNSVSPARIHTPFVDGFIAKNYPGREKEMFENLSQTQPIGRMGTPREVANLVLYLCSDEASFITGTDFPIDGGFIKLNS
ncbi:MAG: SDR family oxidoreductase [Bacteroidetes bacterium]|nr:SDR family oxidoreductase [Bacteroidota bacterium]